MCHGRQRFLLPMRGSPAAAPVLLVGQVSRHPGQCLHFPVVRIDHISRGCALVPLRQGRTRRAHPLQKLVRCLPGRRAPFREKLVPPVDGLAGLADVTGSQMRWGCFLRMLLTVSSARVKVQKAVCPNGFLNQDLSRDDPRRCDKQAADSRVGVRSAAGPQQEGSPHRGVVPCRRQ